MSTLIVRPVGFSTLKLIWRQAPRQERLVVGTLTEHDGRHSFVYDGPDLERARELGFRGYPGMEQLDNEYNGQAMSSFASRLPGRERPDFSTLVGHWDADREMSDFGLLGLTFGRLPTDMFEFIPLIETVQGTSFLSDLAGVAHHKGEIDLLSLPVGTVLALKAEEGNAFDPHAVQVLYEDKLLAYLKKVHSGTVSEAIKAGLEVACSVERIRLQGMMQEVVVRVTFK